MHFNLIQHFNCKHFFYSFYPCLIVWYNIPPILKILELGWNWKLLSMKWFNDCFQNYFFVWKLNKMYNFKLLWKVVNRNAICMVYVYVCLSACPLFWMFAFLAIFCRILRTTAAFFVFFIAPIMAKLALIWQRKIPTKNMALKHSLLRMGSRVITSKISIDYSNYGCTI